MTRKRLSVEPRPACTCGRDWVHNPHLHSCAIGTWAWEQAVLRQARERGEPDPVIDSEVQAGVGAAVARRHNETLRAGVERMRDLAEIAGGPIEPLPENMTPGNLLDWAQRNARGAGNLADLMSGNPARDIGVAVAPYRRPRNPTRTRRRQMGND